MHSFPFEGIYNTSIFSRPFIHPPRSIGIHHMSSPFSAYYGVPPCRGGTVGSTWVNATAGVTTYCYTYSSWTVSKEVVWNLWTTGDGSEWDALDDKVLMVNWDASITGTWGAAYISMLIFSTSSLFFSLPHIPATQISTLLSISLFFS